MSSEKPCPRASVLIGKGNSVRQRRLELAALKARIENPHELSLARVRGVADHPHPTGIN